MPRQQQNRVMILPREKIILLIFIGAANIPGEWRENTGKAHGIPEPRARSCVSARPGDRDLCFSVPRLCTSQVAKAICRNPAKLAYRPQMLFCLWNDSARRRGA